MRGVEARGLLVIGVCIVTGLGVWTDGRTVEPPPLTPCHLCRVVFFQLGEIYERFYKNWDQSEKYYKNCSQSDPDRADAWFYLGTNHAPCTTQTRVRSHHFALTHHPNRSTLPIA